jgi:hypothetical protein
MFGYEREISESFRYANTLKHGSYEQKQEVKEQQRSEQAIRPGNQPVYKGKGILDILLDEGHNLGGGFTPDDAKKKKKRKPGYYKGPRL